MKYSKYMLLSIVFCFYGIMIFSSESSKPFSYADVLQERKTALEPTQTEKEQGFVREAELLEKQIHKPAFVDDGKGPYVVGDIGEYSDIFRLISRYPELLSDDSRKQNYAIFDYPLVTSYGVLKDLINLEVNLLIDVDNRNTLPALKVIDIPGKGKGVVADQNIPADSFIGLYQGIISLQEHVLDSTYKTDFEMKDDLAQLSVDGTEETNKITRYFNHSYYPNIVVGVLFDKTNHYVQFGFKTVTDIKKGEELCWNYGSGYWRNIQIVPLDKPSVTVLYQDKLKGETHIINNQNCYFLFINNQLVDIPLPNISFKTSKASDNEQKDYLLVAFANGESFIIRFEIEKDAYGRNKRNSQGGVISKAQFIGFDNMSHSVITALLKNLDDQALVNKIIEKEREFTA